ncbi:MULTISPECIES: DUF2512 family protein [unclassified Niallia]|uniref:DUF2512 family protein n=1 Tax=unclassified Niallia TaxID=2837522 RepID=UPI0013CF53D8
MKHVKAFAIKFLSTLVLLSLILMILFNLPFTNVFMITVVLGVLAYIIGDLLILPRTNNLVATLSDFGLAFFVIWLMSENFTYRGNTVMMSLIASIGVLIFEYFFHKYLIQNFIQEAKSNPRQEKLQFQTEMAEEFHPNSKTDNDESIYTIVFFTIKVVLK